MGLLNEEKRKNDQPRRVPWWLLILLIGFIFGVMVTLVVAPRRIEIVITATPLPSEESSSILESAKATIEAVSTQRAAQGEDFNSSDFESLMLGLATQQAAVTLTPNP